MSAAARAELADAVSAVTGVNCKPYYRQSLKPGDAFVKLASRSRSANGIGYVATWQIWLALPQDLVAAEKWLDEHGPAIEAALEREFIGGVRTVTPADLIVGAGTATNGVIYEGAREG